MDENNSKYRKGDSGNAGRCTKSRSKKNYTHKRKYHGKKKRECDENSKTDLQVQDVVNKNNLQDTEVSAEVISSSKATACSLKIIGTETNPPASLSLPTTTSSPISGYRLIDMSILADVFMLSSCLGCHSIQCLKLCDINEKKKGLARHLQLSRTVCLYSHTFFTPKQIDLPKKNKGGQKLYDVNVRAIHGCRHVGAGHEHLKKLCCYLNMPEPMLSNNY